MIRVFRVSVLESTRALENTGIGSSDRECCPWCLGSGVAGHRDQVRSVSDHGHPAGQPGPSVVGELRRGVGTRQLLQDLRHSAGNGHLKAHEGVDK